MNMFKQSSHAGYYAVCAQCVCNMFSHGMPNSTLQLTVPVVVLVNFPDADQMESMDTVSLQAVTLADGTTAYIQHDSKASFSDGQLMDGQVIQLEDGSAAYVQHVSMPKAGRLHDEAPQTLVLTLLSGN